MAAQEWKVAAELPMCYFAVLSLCEGLGLLKAYRCKAYVCPHLGVGQSSTYAHALLLFALSLLATGGDPDP